MRILGPGDEFGHPFDPDLDPDKPVANFLEYAKAPHLDLLHDDGADTAPASRGSGRKDGRAELLVIARQDWISTLQSCRCMRGDEITMFCVGSASRDFPNTWYKITFTDGKILWWRSSGNADTKFDAFGTLEGELGTKRKLHQCPVSC